MLKLSKKKDSIAVDFDGVIHGYSDGWKDGTIYDDPIPGVQKALKKLQEKFRIIIFSTRNHDRTVDGKKESNQIDEMRKYMEKHEVPFDEIYQGNGKPLVELYIDDNAYRFEGDWDKSITEIDRHLLTAMGLKVWDMVHDKQAYVPAEQVLQIAQELQRWHRLFGHAFYPKTSEQHTICGECGQSMDYFAHVPCIELQP